MTRSWKMVLSICLTRSFELVLSGTVTRFNPLVLSWCMTRSRLMVLSSSLAIKTAAPSCARDPNVQSGTAMAGRSHIPRGTRPRANERGIV